MDLTTSALVGVLAVNLVGLAFASLKWLSGRIIKNEDEARQHQEVRVEAMEAAIQVLDKDLAALRAELRNAISLFGEANGTLKELRLSMETTRDKQAGYYREQLERTESGLRQELTRAMGPLMLVSELEKRVAALESKRRR